MLVGQNTASVGNVHVTDADVVVLAGSPDWTSEWWYGWEGTLEIGRRGGTGTVVFDRYTCSTSAAVPTSVMAITSPAP